MERFAGDGLIVRKWMGDAAAALTRLLVGTRVRYASCRPEFSPAVLAGQNIFFANHSSHLDFVVLWSALPREMRLKVRPVAAGDYWCKGPARQLLAKHLFRAVLVRRSDDPAVKQANVEALRDALASGASLILFPEGTRGDGRHVAEFRSGIFYLAQDWPAVNLIPVFLANLHRILPKGEVVPNPQPSRITFGDPIDRRAGEARDVFLERTRAALLELKAKRCP